VFGHSYCLTLPADWIRSIMRPSWTCPLNAWSRTRRIVDSLWRLFFRRFRRGWIDLGNDRLGLRRLLGALGRNNGRYFGRNVWLRWRFGFGSHFETCFPVHGSANDLVLSATSLNRPCDTLNFRQARWVPSMYCAFGKKSEWQ